MRYITLIKMHSIYILTENKKNLFLHIIFFISFDFNSDKLHKNIFIIK